MRLRPGLALILLAGLGACESAEQGRAANEAAQAVPVPAPVPADAAVANAAGPDPQEAPRATAADAPALDRLGPVRLGMTVRDLLRAGESVAGRDGPLDEGSTCGYLRLASLPEVDLMLDGERVVRIDVASRAHATLGGVRVGQSEAEALRRLGAGARVEPHPYTGPEGHYLVRHEAGAPHGLIVETDGRTVQGYRFGDWEQVQLIEGCS